MDEKILHKFCSKNSLTGYYDSPWSRGDYTYATNGHVMVRIPRVKDIEENPSATDAKEMFDAMPHPFSGYPVKGFKSRETVCSGCNGMGQNFPCPECDGEGNLTISHNMIDYDVVCGICGGSGVSDSCEECGGDGKLEAQIPTDFHGITFDLKYLALISTLPNCRLAPISKTGPNPVKFDGGEGILMPMAGQGRET